MSRWISTDPAFIKFIPIGNKKNNEKLPAGGVFKSSNLAMFIYASNNPVMYIDPDGKWDDRVHFGNDEYGTLRWAQDVGFSREDAIKIATANAAIDRGSTNPVTGNQSYHFNTNNDPDSFPQNSSTNTSRDSRKILANYHLEKAIELWKMADAYTNYNPEGLDIQKFRDEALAHLGAGLHALQDIYAHSDECVGREAGRWSHYDIPIIPGGTVPKGPITGKDVDEPNNRTNELKSTEEATINYLRDFIKQTGYKGR